MVENALIREKIGFDVIFEFFIYPMWGKKKKSSYLQRLKFGVNVKI